MKTLEANSLSGIEPEILYPISDFMKRTGWGRHAVRAARRNGLVIRRAHNRAYVLGGDFIRYVTEIPMTGSR